ncbi:MAG: Zn-ribbon domain-containing OB-fold protein [Thermoprotei archaeon]
MTKEVKLYGRGLKEDDLKRVILVEDKPSAKYSWSAGIAMSRFLLELKEGRIIGRKCNKCGRILIPPRMYCEACFRPTDEWIYVRDIGRITTAVVSYISADRARLEKPEIVGVIEFEDAPGSGIFHKLNIKPEDVINRKAFGMKVKAAWKPKEQRIGSITDIEYFEPVEE